MEGKNITVGVLVVAVALVVGGYMIYSGQETASPLSNGGVGQQPPSSPPSSSEAPLQNLTSGELAVLRTPKADDTEEVRTRRYELAVKVAQSSDVLDVADCAPDPLVLQTENGQTVTVRNQGKEDVTVNIENAAYGVPAGGATPVTLKLSKDHGLHGYGCNTVSGVRANGFILFPFPAPPR